MRALMYLLLIASLGYIGYNIYKKEQYSKKIIDNKIKVLVVSNSIDKGENSILEAYKSVLQEEGVPFKIISNRELLMLSADKIVEYVPAIIFPEVVNKSLLHSSESWIVNYTKGGGHTALIHDVNIKDVNGNYHTSTRYLDRVMGLNLTVYHTKKENSFSSKKIKFENREAVDFFDISYGRVDKENYIVSYQYGKNEFPMIDIEFLDKKNQTIYALTENKRAVLVEKRYFKGSLLYVNPPLGVIKGNSDELLIRSVLKTLLFKIAKTPHIVSSPNGKGTLVINWHIDSALEHISLPWIFKNNYLRKDFNQTFHITAGPHLDILGDNQGFDAQNRGKALVKRLMEYGTIGSHGGWNHNWFAKNIKDKKFGKEEMKKYIKMNIDTLEKITKEKILEYSAPSGVFPPIESIEILQELGIKSFYYTGDSGSVPNRTFYNGKMLSKEIIAFPVTSFGKYASQYEFNKANIPEDEIKRSYFDFINHIIKSKTTKLFYAHPYDIHLFDYKDAMSAYLDYISTLIKKGELQTRTLTNSREFLIRLIETKVDFEIKDSHLNISIKNQNSLDEQVVAIPKKIGDRDVIITKRYDSDEHYYYIPLDRDIKEAKFLFQLKKGG